jgi:hypothetical protein
MILRALRPSLAAVAFAALLGLAACGPDNGDDREGAAGDDGAGDGGGGSGGDDQGDGAGEPSAPSDEYPCVDVDECVAVSSTCCECPSFVVNTGSDYAAACDQVECDKLPADCPAVEAACIDSLCQLACSTVLAEMTCANGFASDTFGCLVDACREPPGELFACQEDIDCVEAPADCCGCERGGVSTAVAAATLDEYIASLGCPPGEPKCPGVDFCDAELVPRCIAQTCTLGPGGGSGGDDDGGGDDGDGGDGGIQLCGVPDLPPCPKGQACVLNHPDAKDATRMGVGACVDA